MSSVTTFEVSKVTSDLRDHLAQHDKPIAFLFGAGTSCAIQKAGGGGGPLIPTVAALTEICRKNVEALGDKFKAGWKALETNCTQSALIVNVETLLSRLRLIVTAIGKDDVLLGLTREELLTFEQSIRKSIATTTNPSLKDIPEDIPHRRFAAWIAKASRRLPIEIFTLNYDVLFELALERERVPYFDGFIGTLNPFFYGESLKRQDVAPPPTWTRLWKIHGSVTWKREKVGGAQRIIRTAPSDTGEMILPSLEKYDESRQQPYMAFIDRLQRFIEADDAILITVGFSFSDEHINAVILEALAHRPRSHLYALQFSDLAPEHILRRRAQSQRNIAVITPQKGVLGGVEGDWQLLGELPTGVKIFQPDAGSGTKSGKVALGDFNNFCDFLKTFG